jgi:hypothetical protein
MTKSTWLLALATTVLLSLAPAARAQPWRPGGMTSPWPDNHGSSPVDRLLPHGPIGPGISTGFNQPQWPWPNGSGTPQNGFQRPWPGNPGMQQDPFQPPPRPPLVQAPGQPNLPHVPPSFEYKPVIVPPTDFSKVYNSSHKSFFEEHRWLLGALAALGGAGCFRRSRESS